VKEKHEVREGARTEESGEVEQKGREDAAKKGREERSLI